MNSRERGSDSGRQFVRGYKFKIRGVVPANISENISALHAKAILNKSAKGRDAEIPKSLNWVNPTIRLNTGNSSVGPLNAWCEL